MGLDLIYVQKRVLTRNLYLNLYDDVVICLKTIC